MRRRKALQEIGPCRTGFPPQRKLAVLGGYRGERAPLPGCAKGSIGTDGNSLKAGFQLSFRPG